jgi:tetratricopeptide (TPR) repeat protein
MRELDSERGRERRVRPATGARLVAVWVLAAAWLGARPAAAQETSGTPSPRELARQHYDAGAAAFEAGDYAAALVDLDQSYRLFPSLRTLYSLGLCQHALGNSGPALRSLEQYLREAGAEAPADLRARAEELVAQLRAGMGRLEVQVNVEGAEVLVDGEVVGRSPLAAPYDVGPGWHLVEARHESWDGRPQRIEVAAGGSATVTLALAPLPEPPAPPPVPDPEPEPAESAGPPPGVSEQEWYGISDSDYQKYVYSTGRHQPLAGWLLERNRENPDLDLGVILAGSQGLAWLAAGTLVYLVHEKNWESNNDTLPWLSFFTWLLGGALTMSAVLMLIVDALDVDAVAVEHPDRLLAPAPRASAARTTLSEVEQRGAADDAAGWPVEVSLGVGGLVLRF